MQPLFKRTFITSVALTLLCCSSFAWQFNGVAIVTAANTQAPVMVSDSSGGAIFAEWDQRNGASYDIYVEHVDSNGSTIWTNNGVAICTAGNVQELPQLINDGSGGAIIVWQDLRNSSNFAIYAQRINSTGSTLWQDNGVLLCTNGGQETHPAIAPDGNGGAIVAWLDTRNSNYVIYTQHVNSDGSTLWTLDGVSTNGGNGNEISPQIVSDDSGGAIIIWIDDRDASPNYGSVYAQRMNSNGSTLWVSTGLAICTVAYNPSNFGANILKDGSGGAFISWEDDRTSTNTHIYSQRVNSNGSTLWTTNGVAICTAANYQEYNELVSDGAGGVIITWEDHRSGHAAIYAQRVNSSGSSQWIVNGVAITSTLNSAIVQFSPQLVSDGANGAIFSYFSEFSSQNTVNVQHVNSTGSTLWVLNGFPSYEGIPLDGTNTLSGGYPLEMTSDGSNGAIVAWNDNRDGNGVFAERVTSGGLVPVEDWYLDDGDMMLPKRK